MMRFRMAWCLLGATLAIAGCGGGGGSTTTTTKTTPTVTTWPTASAISYGQTLASSTLTGGSASVSGTFAFTTPTTAPGAGTPSEGVTFTPTDTTDYNTVAGTVNVTVNKATPTVSAWPTASAITYGQMLSSSTLSGGTASVGGTFAFTTPATAPTAGTPSEGVTFTPTDAADYNSITGTVTVTVNKATPTVSVWPTASAINSGQALSSSTLTGGTASVPGSFAFTTPATVPSTGTSSQSVTFTPTDSTDYNTVAGTVSVTVNTNTPTVTAVTPASASTGVAVTTALTATFNEAMNASTITTATFTLQAQGSSTGTAGAVTYNAGSMTATFTPTANLAFNTTYIATITIGAQSSTGTALTANYPWSFTTGAAPVPTVTTTVPTSGATGVNVANALTATFSEAMNSSTLTTTTFTVATTSGNTPVTGTVTYNAGTSTATFTPGALAASTSYTATITTGATSSAGAPLASNYTWNFTTGVPANQVTVDFGTTYQTIRGFGGSTAWLGQMPQAVATALFNPTSGLGLSVLRLRIDPTGTASGGGNSGDPYETGEWDYEAANGAEAVAQNPKAIVFATPWTPPAAWKLSGTSTTISGNTWNEALYSGSCSPSGNDESGTAGGYCGGYLDPNHYADYANYLEDFVTFFNTTNSPQQLYAISMQNEPEENVDYESCIWTPAQMDTFVASLTAGGATDPITTKLIMPEADSFQAIQAQTTLQDANAAPNVSIVGGHIYGVSPTAPQTFYSGKDIWMTEFGPLSSAALTWTQALTTYGESIHNSMVTGEYNAYVWWGVFGASTGSCATSAGTCGLVDDAGNVQPMGYVMGQYSKFIQPGFVRVSATATPVAGVFVSAYSNSSPSHYTIVAINSNSTAESIAFTLDVNGNPTSSVTSLTPYQSTSAAGLAAQPAVSVSGGLFNYTLPAMSIVTFYQ
jgi:O-glycosyl hydrolase